MRKILFIGFLFCVFNSYAQSGDVVYHDLTEDIVISRISKIPVENGKILYDQIIDVPGQSANELFTKIRTWFVEKFTDSKEVLQVNDIKNGMLTGKGAYRFEKINGLNSHVGWVTFIMNVKVKDGKFRYQLYSFVYNGTNKSLLGDTRDRGFAETEDLNNALQGYLDGKRMKKNRKFLSDMISLQDYFDKSLRFAVNKKNDISDF